MRESASTSFCDVTVVGAGPVGLLLAGELALRNVQVIVLERAQSPTRVTKANGIVGRSAVELSKRGVLSGTGLRVVSPPRFPFGPLSMNLGFGYRNPLHVLPVPQHRLEKILEERARGHGARILRGVEVLTFDQNAAEVAVETRGGGNNTHFSARFLVGCDGAHSTVRKQAGIGFSGFTGNEIARIARVVLPPTLITRTDFSCDIVDTGRFALMRSNQLPGGSFTIAPVAALEPGAPRDLYLVSTSEPRGEAVPRDPMPVDELRASLRRVIGSDLPFTEATEMRSTVGNSRQAEAYRQGRVFLAGDAAHIFNAGGSALNVGLQDAMDLAERLSAVIREGAAPDELDAYEAIRRPAGTVALQHTRVQAALAQSDENGSALREIVGPMVRRRRVARSLARMIEDA